jgi:hypothetical protein
MTEQPFDRLLNDLQLTPQDLVRASKEQLTFKQVQKARAGKIITPNIQGKILRALNVCSSDKKYTLSELFPLI